MAKEIAGYYNLLLHESIHELRGRRMRLTTMAHQWNVYYPNDKESIERIDKLIETVDALIAAHKLRAQQQQDELLTS